MAEHQIEARILLRYDTLSNWMASNVILKQGEAAVAVVLDERVIDQMSDITPVNTPPAVGIKIGDGRRRFRELPWVQAVAADVYGWAKRNEKPIYTASEIQGLDTYIEENSKIIGDGTIAPRLYQIVQGEGENSNKYYLQYKESTENNWTIDVNHYIDLEDLVKIKNWIGSNVINRFQSLGKFTGEYITSKLNYSDTIEENKFVTSVSEIGGIISVEKAQPTFTNISGILNVNQGGTGKSSFPENEVLVGNGEQGIKLIPIAESIANNNHLVPNKLVKDYVDNAVKGLTGAMHYVGDATVVINNNSTVNPLIEGYNFSNAQPGDVILSESKEFVWTGGYWRLLGDEGSYAVKGSITNSDISEEAAISQNKIANLTGSLSNKVDKIEGKTLSTNDFTDELKQKLEDIGINAETNLIEHIFLNGKEIKPTVFDAYPKSINLEISQFTKDAQDKLEGIQDKAQVNIIEKIIYDTKEIAPDEGTKTIRINPNHHPEHENKIEHIIINKTEYKPNENKQVVITLDDAALNLEVIKGAIVPIPDTNGSYEDVDVSNKKLKLARIAKTGNIEDIIYPGNYVILDCGTSSSVL